ncbi:8238_t:CDS:2 [Funneliformis mosseae]|uniref:8238_t:CDS:1 n=1 Tax=Funneliformis mosseae TaxID=27381 RepID=A0A9N9HLG9_FUNMO|nr:8238_t:CDS:2 [Funneliformis mosseae]
MKDMGLMLGELVKLDDQKWWLTDITLTLDLDVVCINTQQSFEALNQRAVAVVVDPMQSVKIKVVIDVFRLINPQMLMLGQEPRQITSNIGHLNKPSIQARSLI